MPSLDASAVPPQDVVFTLCGIPSSAPLGNVSGATITYVSDEAGNFWPLWWSDATAAGLSYEAGDYTPGWSNYSDAPPLMSSKAVGLFQAGLPRYQAAATLVQEGFGTNPPPIVGSDHCLRFSLAQMPPHTVALIQIPGCA